MEVTCSSETLVGFQPTTRRYIPEYRNIKVSRPYEIASAITGLILYILCFVPHYVEILGTEHGNSSGKVSVFHSDGARVRISDCNLYVNVYPFSSSFDVRGPLTCSQSELI
jgi:hypothetical protein